MSIRRITHNILLGVVGFVVFFNVFRDLMANMNPEMRRMVARPIHLAVVGSFFFTLVFLAIISIKLGWL